MALYGVFTCNTCGLRATGLSDPPVWSMRDECPIADCDGKMNGDTEYPAVVGTWP